MLNIDSEEEGIFLVSCAGGARMDLHFPMESAEPAEGHVYRVSISKLTGGHSGTEINKGRANAIVLMGQIIKKLAEARLFIAINDIKGGTADNAICNTCEATILCKTVEPELFEIIKFEVLEDYLSVETAASITLTEENTAISELKWFMNTDDKVEGFLTSIPNGVVAMSQDIEGLVETSLNQGIISMGDDGIDLSLSVRSSIDSKKQELVKFVSDNAAAHHCTVGVRGDYPGWAFRKDSPLRERMISTWQRMYGETPRVEALHAGLECGVFAQKIQDLDCVSFGPNLYDIHTTKERMSLSSAEKLWNFILEILL